MSDYYIGIDEKGQPYIAHGIKDTFSNVRQKGAKYLEKIKTKTGGTRYFYTPEGLKVYYDQGQQKVSETAKNVKAKATSAYNKGRAAVTSAGAKAKSAATNAVNKGRSAVSTAARNAKDFGARTANALKTHGSETLKDISEFGGKAKEKAKDLAGADEYERYEEAWDRTSKAKENLAKNPNSARAQREVDEAEKAEAKAHEDYLKSPLGRLNDAKSRVQETAERAKDKAKELAGSAKEKADQVAGKAKDIGSETLKDISEFGGKAKEKAKDLAGVDEFNRYEEAWNRTSEAKDRLAKNPNSARAQREVDEAEKAEAKAHDDYLKSPLGRLNDAKSRAKELVDSAKDKAKELGDSAKEKAGQAGNKAKELADSAKDKAKELAGSAKEKAGQAVDKAKEKANKVVDNVKDKVGVDERERLGDAIKEYNEASSEDKDKAYQKVGYAAMQYMNTPLGKIENGAQKAKTTAKAVAAAAGVAVAAVPAVAIGLPLTAAVAVTRATIMKVNEIRDNNIAQILTMKSKLKLKK